MKFLVDNALSPDVAITLSSYGHDAVHVRDLGIATATDEVIFERAAFEDRVIVSADTDFGTLLALRHETRPSVILFRGAITRKPTEQGKLIAGNLSTIEGDLNRGAIVTFEPGRLRVRSLPIP